MQVTYVGTWLIFGIVLMPVYMMLLGWILGKPRNLHLLVLGVGYLIGLTVLLWTGMFAFSMVVRWLYFS